MGSAWEDLGGEVADGLISVQRSGFSTYGVLQPSTPIATSAS